MSTSNKKIEDEILGELKGERLSAKQERLLAETLEQIPMTDELYRADTILTLAGFKQATEIEICVAKKYPGKPETLTESDKHRRIEESIKRLQTLGLHVLPGKREKVAGALDTGLDLPGPDNGWADLQILYISLKEIDARKLSTLAVGYGRGNERELGHLYGFPPTAVDAFTLTPDEKRNGKDRAREDHLSYDLPDDAWEPDYMVFAQFVFSRAHWKEELETVKQWAKTVQKYYPELYKRLIHRRHPEKHTS